MRLEFLFEQTRHSLRGTSVWDSRATLEGIIDIQNLVSRSDLKTEVLKELDRHTTNLAKLEQNPGVDKQRLSQILDELDVLIDRIYSNNQQIGHEIKLNEFLNSVRQRVSVPGGTCDFDLPGYHYWLERLPEQRIHDLNEWLGCFDVLRQAIDVMLRLIRESAIPKIDTATAGFYQKSMDPGCPCQMLRIGLPLDVDFFPEVSGGKHRFTIRFLRYPDYDTKPKQIDEAIEFEMACCSV